MLLSSCTHVRSKNPYYMRPKQMDSSLVEHNNRLLCEFIFAGGFLNDTVSLAINEIKIIDDYILTSDPSEGLTEYSIEYYRPDSIIIINYEAKPNIIIKFNHLINIKPTRFFSLVITVNGVCYRYKIRLSNFHYIDINYNKHEKTTNIRLFRTPPMYE